MDEKSSFPRTLASRNAKNIFPSSACMKAHAIAVEKFAHKRALLRDWSLERTTKRVFFLVSNFEFLPSTGELLPWKISSHVCSSHARLCYRYKCHGACRYVRVYGAEPDPRMVMRCCVGKEEEDSKDSPASPRIHYPSSRLVFPGFAHE